MEVDLDLLKDEMRLNKRFVDFVNREVNIYDELSLQGCVKKKLKLLSSVFLSVIFIFVDDMQKESL